MTAIQPLEYALKLLIIGDAGVGKSAIIRRLTNNTFSSHYKATIGVDFGLLVFKVNEYTTVRLQLWDLAGQERFANLTRNYYQGAAGALVVYDIKNPKSLEGAEKWKKDLDAKVTQCDGKPLPAILVANKCDLDESATLPTEEMKKMNFSECALTSAKENIGLQEVIRKIAQIIIETGLHQPSALEQDISAHQLKINHPKTTASSSSCSC